MSDAAAAIEHIRSYVERHRALLDTPGLALAVTDRERCLGVLTDGLANVDAGTPVAPEHRFQIGSISKGFTALALLLEREAGRLDLDAPVTEYLPWFEVRSAFPPIRIHHLLSHTSGLVPGMDFTGEGMHEVWALRETETGFAPGERFLYSNVGYKTLGLVLETIARRPWWEVVRERVMEPIGMGSADVIITNEGRARQAVGYASPFDDRPWQPRHGWAPAPWAESGTADGTICATAEELAVYARLLLNGGRGVVSEESFARMTEPVLGDPDAPEQVYGYGVKWIEEEGARRLLGHSGGMVGFTAYLLADVETGFGVTVLCNSPFSRRLDLVKFALRCLAAGAEGVLLPDIPEPTDRASVPDASAYAGTYRDEHGTLLVGALDDRLFLIEDGLRVPLAPVDVDPFPEDADRFLVDADGLDRYGVRFVRDEGVVTQMFRGPRWLVNDRYRGPLTFEHLPEWGAFVGHYRSWNPWAPGFRVHLRRGELWVVFAGETVDGGGEHSLTPLPDGSFRVGEPWSPDRVRFDTPIDGRATRAVFDAAPFYRTFTP
jgi:CubicO group peptidase (beta-lactamase class C family)